MLYAETALALAFGLLGCLGVLFLHFQMREAKNNGCWHAREVNYRIDWLIRDMNDKESTTARIMDIHLNRIEDLENDIDDLKAQRFPEAQLVPPCDPDMVCSGTPPPIPAMQTLFDMAMERARRESERAMFDVTMEKTSQESKQECCGA